MGVVVPLQVPAQLGMWVEDSLSNLLGIIQLLLRGQIQLWSQVSLQLLLIPNKTLMLKIQKVIIFYSDVSRVSSSGRRFRDRKSELLAVTGLHGSPLRRPEGSVLVHSSSLRVSTSCGQNESWGSGSGFPYLAHSSSAAPSKGWTFSTEVFILLAGNLSWRPSSRPLVLSAPKALASC